MKKALDEVPRRGGYYNWLFLHKGEMLPFSQDIDFEKYDVVSMNMSPVDQVLVPQVRAKIPKSSSTLLILNNDYVAEAWTTWGTHPIHYENIQALGDVCYSTEPHQVSLMREGTYTIPHPHWIKTLKHLNVQWNHSSNNIGAIYHWWSGKSYIESLLFYKLQRKYPKLWSRLYAYYGKDEMRRWQKVLFNEQMKLLPYPEYLRSLATNKFLLENCRYHTYGRNTVDTAALGIPSVGSDRVFSMKLCWPEMCCDPIDGKKMMEIMEKVIKGGSWLDKQLDYAYEACEHFNYQNSRERYMSMVEETSRRLGK